MPALHRPVVRQFVEEVVAGSPVVPVVADCQFEDWIVECWMTRGAGPVVVHLDLVQQMYQCLQTLLKEINHTLEKNCRNFE